MPLERNLTPEQALKLIADTCRAQTTNIAIVEAAVEASFNTPGATFGGEQLGPNVVLHRNTAGELASTIKQILDISDRNVT